ncbi:SAF domain-containing protein [Brevibacillus massiliensis]|uniref:SAF domain-containing protein n=1 Tax=Brevibacillus massiliensis TaxID=1118054 RepID=UPI00031B1310|nr:SAF domain-containing protein [Brevibacillus massiliensis]
MKINKRTISILFFLSSALSAGAIYLGYDYVRTSAAEAQYTSVLAIKEGKLLQAYTPIIQSDLVYKKIPVNQYAKGMLVNPEDVIGKTTWLPIGEGEPIFDWKLTDGKLLPQKDEARYEIPLTDFTPMSEIRRGDHVKVWVKYRPMNEEHLEELGEPKFFTKTNDSADMLFTSQVVAVKDGAGAEVFSLSPPQASTQAFADLMDNQQVSSTAQNRLTETYRGQPDTMPARLIFNWTDKQFQAFVEARKYGDVQIGVYQYYKQEELEKAMRQGEE